MLLCWRKESRKEKGDQGIDQLDFDQSEMNARVCSGVESRMRASFDRLLVSSVLSVCPNLTLDVKRVRPNKRPEHCLKNACIL
jgi:hypothetical protein